MKRLEKNITYQPTTEEEEFKDYVYRCSLLNVEEKLKVMEDMRDFFIKYKINNRDKN